jgi:hypothetical protein
MYKQKTNTMDYLKRRYIGVKGLDGSLDDETGRFLLLVPALYVDKKYVAYCCPPCSKTHKHGSGGDLFNRVESRWSHCRVKKSDVEIVISSLTPRVRPLDHRNALSKNPSGFVVVE